MTNEEYFKMVSASFETITNDTGERSTRSIFAKCDYCGQNGSAGTKCSSCGAPIPMVYHPPVSLRWSTVTIENSIIRTVAKSIPQIIPLLSGRARWIAMSAPSVPKEVKTEDALYRQVWGAIQDLYSGGDSGAFIGDMANIVQEQLTKAFRAALRDSGLDADTVTDDPFAPALEGMILAEYDEVDGLASDVQRAAKDDGDVNQFQNRAKMWANRYNDAYNQALLLIAKMLGDNLEWVYGDTNHCETCEALNGIIASADDWVAAGVQPQQPPNDALDCGGWHCDCKLQPAFKPATPDALSKIMEIRR